MIFKSIDKYFSVDIKYEVENIKNVESERFFMTNEIWNISNANKMCTVRVNIPLPLLIWIICK